jgi:hypothetical protein
MESRSRKTGLLKSRVDSCLREESKNGDESPLEVITMSYMYLDDTSIVDQGQFVR